MKKFESELGPDLLGAVARLGLSVTNFSEISRKPGGPGGRACFRLQLDNGQILKGRHYGSAERCREVVSLYGFLEGLPFGKVLASSGQSTVEQWIEGTSLDSHEIPRAQFDSLVNLLGILHIRPVVPDDWCGNARTLDDHLNSVSKKLCVLAKHDCLRDLQAVELKRLVESHLPVHADTGLIHMDFHPRNMVLGQDRKIWIVDNELLRLGIIDLDVARSWRLWPMTPEQREQFGRTYGKLRDLDNFLSHQVFWAIITLVGSAHYHLRLGRPIQHYLHAMQRILDGDEGGYWELS
jgi:hypothetical protein